MAYDPALEALVDKLGTEEMDDALKERSDKKHAEKEDKKK